MDDAAEHLRAAAAASRAGPLRGLWLTVLTAEAIEGVLPEGVDWIGVDLQHGSLEVSHLAPLLRVCPVPLVARAASGEPAHLARVLDTGVAGIIVPGVSSAAEAASVVSACRLPPDGCRSTGASRSSIIGSPVKPLLLPMVETRRGMSEVDGIAWCDGVDGVFIGPYDLSLSLGHRSVEDSEVLNAIRVIVDVTRRRGALTGVFSGNGFLESRLPEVDLLAVDTDRSVLRHGLSHMFGRSTLH